MVERFQQLTDLAWISGPTTCCVYGCERLTGILFWKKKRVYVGKLYAKNLALMKY